MNTSNKNPNVSFNTNKTDHHEWAKGFKKGEAIIYHPYTRKDFVFGENTNEL